MRVEAGAEAEVVIEIPTKRLAHWDEGWQYEPGEFTLRVGTRADDLPLSATVSLEVPE